MLSGNEEELLHVIPILLGCSIENIQERKLIDDNAVPKLLSLMKEAAFSHLMEVKTIHLVEQFSKQCAECVPVCIGLNVDTLSLSFDFCLIYIYSEICRLSWKLLLKQCTMNYWKKSLKTRYSTFHHIIAETLLSNH